MPAFTVQCDISEQVAGLRDLEKTQLPFATAATLTELAKLSQEAVRSRLKKPLGAFIIRNEWTKQGIRYKPADKKGSDGTIQADVHTDTANRATGAPDYMGRQEDGGEKIPYGGRQHLAVPTDYLRRMVAGAIPAELRPKNLLGATGGRFLVSRRGKAGALRSQRLVRGFDFFLQKLHDGHTAILGRYMTDRDAYPFYLLIPEAHVEKSKLDMHGTVQRTVEANRNQVWEENWRKIRLRGIRI